MFYAFLDALFAFLFLLQTVAAAPQNSTIDDQDFSKITYARAADWNHDPLQGWENDFNHGSRSFTYVPGATASFTFTGYGIWVQGPFAPDQAQRRVFLNGMDMGAFNARAPERQPSRPFWGTGDLEYTTHTVVITHNDTAQMILALDAWIVEYDYSRTPAPYTTTTITETAPTPTLTATGSNGEHFPGVNGTVSGNPDTSVANSPRSYSAIIIGIVVPILFLLFLCICGFFIYRRRHRTRTAQRRRESFKEKFLRRQPVSLQSPLTPAFGERVGDTGPLVAGAGRRRRSDEDARAVSPHTFASTRYSTALDHTYEMDQDVNQGRIPPVSPFVATRNTPVDLLDAAPLSAGMELGTSSNGSSLYTGTSAPLANKAIMRPSPATFDPPAEWRTTLTSTPGPAVPGPSNPLSRSDANDSLAAAAAATAALSGTERARRGSPSGTDNHRGAGTDAKQSTVFSETDSGYSYAGSPSRYYQHQPDPGNGDVNALPSVVNARSNSVLRRFSTAITSTLRGTSRPKSRYSNSHAMSGGNVPGGDDPSSNAARNEEDLENNESPRGYFRGVNHFNLGIPLNYRPSATTPSGYNNPPLTPTPLSPPPVPRAPKLQTDTKLTRQSQNLNSTDALLDGGGSSIGDTYRSTPAPTTPGSALGASSPFDDLAFSSYTRQTRERALGLTTTAEHGDRIDAAAATAPAPAKPKTDESVVEPEEKDEKIRENLDGDTIQGETEEDEGQWSVGHGTLASQGGGSSGGHGGGVARRGSAVSRQRSIRSIAEQGRQPNPPPYSVYIPPETKSMPPPGS